MRSIRKPIAKVRLLNERHNQYFISVNANEYK